MTVQSLTRAFHILETVAREPNGIGVNAIARRTQLHKSTVSRLLATLEALAAVERTEAGQFQIGAGIFALTKQAPLYDQLIRVAEPVMRELGAQVHEDIGLAVPYGNQVRYIYQVSSDRDVQVKDWTGESLPLHTTSTGKIILAYAKPEFVETYMRRPLAATTEYTLTTPAQLMPVLAQIRQQGFDWTEHEFAVDLAALSAPIWGPDGSLVAAINIYGPIYRFPAADQADAISQMTVAAANEVSRQLAPILSHRNGR